MVLAHPSPFGSIALSSQPQVTLPLRTCHLSKFHMRAARLCIYCTFHRISKLPCLPYYSLHNGTLCAFALLTGASPPLARVHHHVCDPVGDGGLQYQPNPDLMRSERPKPDMIGIDATLVIVHFRCCNRSWMGLNLSLNTSRPFGILKMVSSCNAHVGIVYYVDKRPNLQPNSGKQQSREHFAKRVSVTSVDNIRR